MGCCANIGISNINSEIIAKHNKIKSKLSKHETAVRKTIKKSKKIENSARLNFDHSEIILKEKSDSQILDIKNAINNHFLFKTITSENIKAMIAEMKLCIYEVGQIIFTKGDPAYNFYIISEGSVEIMINSLSTTIMKKGECFGELALLHDSTRTATIKTREHTALWIIDRELFKSAVTSVFTNFYLENNAFFESLEFYKKLTNEAKEVFLAQAAYHEFSNNQEIIKENDPGNYLYIIKSGKVKCTVSNDCVRYLETGEIICEQAALFDINRTAVVTAVGKVSLFSIGNLEIMLFFRNSLQELYRNTLRISLETDFYFKYLNTVQQDMLISKLRILYFEPCNIVINKGTELGMALYIILKGSLKYKNNIYKRNSIIGTAEIINENYEFIENDIFSTEIVIIAELLKNDIEDVVGGKLKKYIDENEIMNVLKKVQLFKSLSMLKLRILSSNICLVNFNNEECIFSKNDPSNSFYIVKEGRVRISIDGNFIRYINVNDYFGERSILLNQYRAADAYASGDCECWVLTKQNFVDIIDEKIRVQLQKRLDLQNEKIELEDLSLIKHIGNGMYGSVFLVVGKENNLKYALKVVSRSKIAAYHIQDLLLMEKKILFQIDHPFILKLVKTFKDQLRIYFLTEYIQGIELYDAMQEIYLLSNELSKFYVGCLLLILEYLHERFIYYRDLKPENIMIDKEGYPKLIDFGTSKLSTERSITLIGTPHYMAPEVIKGAGYDFSCDLWSLGVMCYEFMIGTLPFGDGEEDLAKIYESILSGNYRFPKKFENIEARPFIEKLLNQDPSLRVTAHELKNNAWFIGINWEYLLGKQVKPPFIPRVQTLVTENLRDLKESISVNYI